jgi:GT2 family glycosyltransferase
MHGKKSSKTEITLIMEKEIIPVILLTYKDSHLVKSLLVTINEEHLNLKIIILDNGYTNNSWTSLNEIADQRIILIRSATNLGYTGGINYAVKYALQNIANFSYFFIINPDTQCTPNLIFHLRQILEANSNAACVSPKILSMDRKITYSGGKINLKKGTVKHIVFTDNSYPMDSYEVDSYTGCAVLFNITQFVNCGMLNEKLFIYYDEADSSLKLRANNYKILYAPSLEVHHDTSYTMRKVSYLKTYYMTRNKFIVFNNKMGLFNKLYFVVFEFAYHIKNKRIKNAIYHLKGVYHFLIGKTGAYN